jgi:hypothetical protein
MRSTLRFIGAVADYKSRALCAVAGLPFECCVGMSPNDWRATFDELRRRVMAVKLLSDAVRADAAATLERIRRARAVRQGAANTPEPPRNFVPARRSSHTD